MPRSCRPMPIFTARSEKSAKLFADRIFTLLFGAQVVLLVVAWLFMPQVIAILAPGFSDDPMRGELAISLTRITFPYLLLITLVTLYGGMLNVMHRFASAAAAPIFLNLSMMATLALAAFFPGAGHAAAWGVLIAGFLEFFLLAGDAARQRHPAAICAAQARRRRPRFFSRAWACDGRLDGDAGRAVRRYHHRDVSPRRRAVGAVLCRPAQSAADRRDRHRHRHRAAAGNVAATDHRAIKPGAAASQRRAFDFTLLFSVPFVAAFLTVPDVIMRAMFARGAFSKADAAAAGATLAAYAIGLIPFVLIRSAVATFYARKDTATPVKAALTGVAVNVALKIALVGSLAQVGLALATAVGAWVNLLLVIGFAVRAGYLELDRRWCGHRRSSSWPAFCSGPRSGSPRGSQPRNLRN